MNKLFLLFSYLPHSCAKVSNFIFYYWLEATFQTYWNVNNSKAFISCLEELFYYRIFIYPDSVQFDAPILMKIGYYCFFLSWLSLYKGNKVDVV